MVKRKKKVIPAPIHCCNCNNKAKPETVIKKCGLLGFDIIETKSNKGCKCLGCQGTTCDTCSELQPMKLRFLIALCQSCKKAR
ncbi:MAG: hypothetical protein MJ156_03205 [Alphaproteobacteria bacterium]|nr:hypothetical protein [Alphaproteobacteria bacterium]